MSSIDIETGALSEVERIKQESGGLRGTLADELAEGGTTFSDTAKQLLKFHGSYEQEDRDLRRERKQAGLEPAWQFMVRSKIPGGALTAAQYLVHDELAERFGNGTLRITTRQGIQLHGVIKGDLRATIATLNEALVTTLGACGDVVRNVVGCPAPLPGTARAEALSLVKRVSDRFLPATRAYHEIWVDGEKVAGGEPEPEVDPVYGDRYLPRKFKIAFAFPDDNCTDVHTNDLGLLVIERDGALAGFNVLVGGGLGRTHGKTTTYPRLADPLAFVPPDEVLEVAAAVIAVQRDWGNRTDRRHARLKYLLDERGIGWFRAEVERELGRALLPPLPVTVTGVHDHLGWHRQGDGRWFYGIFVENGRVSDTPKLRLRSALREAAARFGAGVHLTTQQNVLLTDIPGDDRASVERLLAEHGLVPLHQLSGARRWSMACPALPTCGLALAESERVLPAVMDRLETELAKIGLADEPVSIRMTGCPNGCARPYTAELAFVGRSLGKYAVYLGGSWEGTRLATPWADLVPLDDLVPTVLPLFERFARERTPGEAFGDFHRRVTQAPAVAAEVAA
ncbi:MAG TPA: NADPH-dependent assimilatory sulfite reductase hemoprotein subunit [Longimicrobium sp.]